MKGLPLGIIFMCHLALIASYRERGNALSVVPDRKKHFTRHLRLQYRRLQEESPPTACNGTVNEANEIIFASEFQPMCQCEEVNTDQEVEDAINALNTSDTDAFVDGFNQALGRLTRSSEYSCVNQCESCFDTYCGLWQTSQGLTIANRPGNFSLEEIAAQNISSDDIFALINTTTFHWDSCITYTINQSGTLCASVHLNSIPDEEQDQPCSITYNNQACNSCVLTAAEPCFVADCTNLDEDGGAMIDTCTDTGLVGPFAALRYMLDDDSDPEQDINITLGRCDVPALAPMAAPTSTSAAPRCVLSSGIHRVVALLLLLF